MLSDEVCLRMAKRIRKGYQTMLQHRPGAEIRESWGHLSLELSDWSEFLSDSWSSFFCSTPSVFTPVEFNSPINLFSRAVTDFALMPFRVRISLLRPESTDTNSLSGIFKFIMPSIRSKKRVEVI